MPANNARDWFQRADSDLLNIENNLNAQEIPWDTIVFHAHQAIEKYLKGLLVANGALPQRSHDLVELIRTSSRFAPAVLPFEQDCRLLNRLYVACRYPEANVPQEPEARQALQVARKVKAIVLKAGSP